MRYVASTFTPYINGKLIARQHAVIDTKSELATCITGTVGDEYDAQSRADAERIAKLLNSAEAAKKDGPRPLHELLNE